MKALKIFSILVILFLLACNEDSSTAPEKAVYIDGQSYRNEIIGIELTAPTNWELKMNQKVAGMTALLVGNRITYNNTATSFNVITENANGMKNADEFILSSEMYILENFHNALIEAKTTKNINGFDFAELIYTFEYNGIELKQRQVIFLCSEKLIAAITFTAENSDYTEIASEFDLIINSIKML